MAVYTELSENEIRAFLGAYALPSLARAQGIQSGVENTNYLLVMEDDRKLILTLFERRMNIKDIPFFAELMQHLARHHIPCPLPVPPKNGAWVETFKDKPALIVSFLHGAGVNTITPLHVRALGAQTAQMHNAVRHFKGARDIALSIKSWAPMYESMKARLDEITPKLAQTIAHELDWLKPAWPTHLPRGVIHGDLFPDNVFFDAKGNLTGIIDFYLAGNDFFAYELAIAMNAWCFDAKGDLDTAKTKALFDAYQTVRPLTDAEREAMPVLARGAALCFLLLRAQHGLFPAVGALMTPKDPMEYLQKLQFHQKVTHHSEYGF